MLTREEELEWEEFKRLEEIHRAQRPKPVLKISSAPTSVPTSNPTVTTAALASVNMSAEDDKRINENIGKPWQREPRKNTKIKIKGGNPDTPKKDLNLRVTKENKEIADKLVARQQRFMATNEAKSLSYIRGGVFAAGAIGAGIGRHMAGEGEGEKTAGTGMGMAIGLTGAGIVSNDIKKELKNNRTNLDRVLRLTEDPSYYPFEGAPSRSTSVTRNETKIKKELNLGENLTYESEEFNSLRDRHRVRTERNLPPSIAPSDAPKIGQLPAPPAPPPPAAAPPPAPAATPPAPAATLAAPAAAPAPTTLRPATLAPTALTPPAPTATLAPATLAPATLAPATLAPPALTPPAPTATLAPATLTPPALTPPAPTATLAPATLAPATLTPPAPTATLAPAALTPPALTPAPPATAALRPATLAPAALTPPAPTATPPAPTAPAPANNIYKNIAPLDAPRIEIPIDPANEIGKIRDVVMPRTKIDITKQTAKREAMRAFHEANSASFYKGKNAAMLAATALLAAGAGLAFNTADKSSGLNSKRGNRI